MLAVGETVTELEKALVVVRRNLRHAPSQRNGQTERRGLDLSGAPSLARPGGPATGAASVQYPNANELTNKPTNKHNESQYLQAEVNIVRMV